IPFDVPDDPLTAARIDHLRDSGGEPFSAFQIPRAALALKQGFGRLIRGHGDFGIVAMLDGRLLQKPYGRDLVATLPADCPRVETLDEVATFWSRGPIASADRVRAELARAATTTAAPSRIP
ncbi:MAG TPA: helicase C-terminal domain-containing protein, partial [Polyangia bacterium]|nr:helicase C-terminal domain-containing protein [Polyangia bacterium]